jgi:hypothetical protein
VCALKVKGGVIREGLVPDTTPFGQEQAFYLLLGIILHVAQHIRCKDEQVRSQ